MVQAAFETILWERVGDRATLTLNRPEQRNGITPTMMDELHVALGAAARDESLRVLVLRGAGRDFCPGADVKFYAAEKRSTNLATFEVSVFLHEMPAVTVAAIRGACAGAGLGWAAACDLRVASATARFNTAFLGVGLSGDMGGPWTLPRIIGAAKARELYLLPGKFDAAEALRIGLVSRVFEDEAFEAGTDAVAAQLMAAAPLALAAMKGNFVAAEKMGLAEFIPFEAKRHSATGATADSREAMTAFVEKRAPKFVGR
ncbi:MAG TPA: enoyl-CoA hydratase-related protein [Phenylobacterium sp.]|nr:enoyl-CoA hydratase-related protein [Phenylobacterium sp.]